MVPRGAAWHFWLRSMELGLRNPRPPFSFTPIFFALAPPTFFRLRCGRQVCGGVVAATPGMPAAGVVKEPGMSSAPARVTVGAARRLPCGAPCRPAVWQYVVGSRFTSTAGWNQGLHVKDACRQAACPRWPAVGRFFSCPLCISPPAADAHPRSPLSRPPGCVSVHTLPSTAPVRVRSLGLQVQPPALAPPPSLHRRRAAIKLRVVNLKKGLWDYPFLNTAGVKVAATQPDSAHYCCGLLPGLDNLIDLCEVDRPSTLRAINHANQWWVLVDEASHGVVSAPVARYEDTVQTVPHADPVRSVFCTCIRHGALEAAVAAAARGTTTATAASPQRPPATPPASSRTRGSSGAA